MYPYLTLYEIFKHILFEKNVELFQRFFKMLENHTKKF